LVEEKCTPREIPGYAYVDRCIAIWMIRLFASVCEGIKCSCNRVIDMANVLLARHSASCAINAINFCISLAHTGVE